MSETLLALSLLAHELNQEDPRNEETQCMLILTSDCALLLVANNNDNITDNWTEKSFLRCTGSVLLDQSKGRKSYLSPDEGSKQKNF
ncbi:hypothetical protein ACJJIR_16785 [Microbulbifer sp. SSSA008]|uniref:hypothetical protein n=1 Tax=Microbulbifer sp. SSSA008 TaxID=3243380 RepID=UPI00403A3DD7